MCGFVIGCWVVGWWVWGGFYCFSVIANVVGWWALGFGLWIYGLLFDLVLDLLVGGFCVLVML